MAQPSQCSQRKSKNPPKAFYGPRFAKSVPLRYVSDVARIGYDRNAHLLNFSATFTELGHVSCLPVFLRAVRKLNAPMLSRKRVGGRARLRRRVSERCQPTDPAPARLDFTGAVNFASLSPSPN